MKKVVFVGASTPNLYGARKLEELGFEVCVYEKNPSHANNQNRILPVTFLNKLGITISQENYGEKEISVKLSSIKDQLAQGLDIVYNAPLQVYVNTEDIYFKEELLEFDVAVINTGHKELGIEGKRFYYYNYLLPKNLEENHFQGKSLITSVEKVDAIIENIQRRGENFNF